jgi:alpha-tubulin suppressor-like RCC1 family protein
LDKLKKYFNEDIKISFDNNQNLLIITKDDKVYDFEKNLENSSLIEFSSTNSIIESKIVNELCNKNILDIKYGDLHYIVLTSDGCVYSWSKNNMGPLGRGEIVDNIYKPVLID